MSITPAASDGPRLAHVAAGPSSPSTLRVETERDHEGPWQPNWPAGTERVVLGRDPVSGGSLTLLRFPPGYDRLDEAAICSRGEPQRFEHHSCHEEIVCLEGDYTFGEPELYDFSAQTYLNHPPFWLHPARQRSSGGVLLLVRNSHPVDFGFCDIPHDWDGVESYFDGPGVTPAVSEAVTRLPLGTLEVGPIIEHGQTLDGVRGHLIWVDEVVGWETWLIEADAGAMVASPGSGQAVGDEWFVLAGSLASGDGGPSLGQHGHWCDPESMPVGGAVLTAGPEGVRALRWIVRGVIGTA